MNIAFEEIHFPLRIYTEQFMTDDELLRFCAVNDIFRIEREPDGGIVLRMLPGGEADGRIGEISVALVEWNRREERGKTLLNAGFILPDGSMRGPTLAWMSNERWNSVDPADRKGFAHICPEFVIEYLPHWDRLAETQAKMQMWLTNGCKLAWLVDPERQVVEIYRTGLEPEVLEDGSCVDGDGPVAGFELVMRQVWDS
jgi:Uma2 family endonuclease